MELLSALDLLGIRANNRFPYLNNGGCCVYAANVGKELRKFGIDVEGVVSSKRAGLKSAESISNVRPKLKEFTLREWEEQGICFSHIGIEFKYKGKLWYHDSNGTQESSDIVGDYPIYIGRLRLVEMALLSIVAEGWNEAFNRREIPKLKKLIESVLKDAKTA